MDLQILYEDKNLIVVIKPAGVSSQESHDFNPDMPSLIAKHTGVNPYVVHRLDQMTSGVMVYALDKATASALKPESKIYHAVLEGIPKDKKGTYSDFLVKDAAANISRVCDAKTKGAKDAKLNYKVIGNKFAEGHQRSKVEVELLTGRHHQIRAQFGSRGTPIVGDSKYGYKGENKPLALAAVRLSFVHPKTKKVMTFGYEWKSEGEYLV